MIHACWLLRYLLQQKHSNWLYSLNEFYKGYEAKLSIASQLTDNHRFSDVHQNLWTDHVYMGFSLFLLEVKTANRQSVIRMEIKHLNLSDFYKWYIHADSWVTCFNKNTDIAYILWILQRLLSWSWIIASQLFDNHRFSGVHKNLWTDHVYGFHPIGADIKIVYIIKYNGIFAEYII